jgi:hypothetical protein
MGLTILHSIKKEIFLQRIKQGAGLGRIPRNELS